MYNTKRVYGKDDDECCPEWSKVYNEKGSEGEEYKKDCCNWEPYDDLKKCCEDDSILLVVPATDGEEDCRGCSDIKTKIDVLAESSGDWEGYTKDTLQTIYGNSCQRSKIFQKPQDIKDPGFW